MNIKLIPKVAILVVFFLVYGVGDVLSRAAVFHVDKDCADFVTQEQAQAYFESLGGSPRNNVDRLDNDHDGIPCESNVSVSNLGGNEGSQVKMPSIQFSGEVIHVVDGDTIIVSDILNRTTIRLSEIDCPEKNQSFGDEATEFTSGLVLGKTVTLNVVAVDKYGRRVASVILSNGQNLNRELIKAGFAWWYKWFSQDTTLGDLEAEARHKKIGLWQEKKPIAPWVFR